MKTFKMTLLAALISSPLAAEGIDKTWEVGVFADYIQSSTHKEDKAPWDQIEAGKGLGIDLQKIINDEWDARLELSKTRYDVQNGNDKDYGTRFGIDAIYKVDNSVYLFAGVKRFNNVRSYNAVNVGGGFDFPINENLSWYTEAAVYRDLDYGYTDRGLKIGLKYAFGDVKNSPIVNKAVEEKVAPQPLVKQAMSVDTDNDGVNDDKDNCNNTPANVKVDSQGCSLYTEKKVAIDLNVKFENNSSKIKPEMENNIQRLADFMTEYKETNVVIEGHTSAAGTDDYNQMISQKRADRVKNVLINKFSIDASRLSAIGFGETQLLSAGTSREDNMLNRRVVAKIETIIKTEINKD